MKATVSWFGDEVTGGSETIWSLFNKHLGFESINYNRASTALAFNYAYSALGFAEIDASLLIEEYIKEMEKYTEPGVLIVNSMQIPTYEPNSATICLIQDCHAQGVEMLSEHYSLFDKLRIGKGFDAFQELTVKNSDLVIFVSDFCRDAYMAHHPDMQTPFKVINHGVDLEMFKPLDKKKSRKTMAIPEGKPIGLWVGRLHPQKGANEMVELQKSRQDINWVWCLMGHIPDNLPEFDNVTILNNLPRKHMPKVYNSADFFILPAYCESFGLASLEAAACDVPIVSNKTGWLFSEKGNVGEILPTNCFDVDKYSIAIDLVLTGEYTPRGVAQKYPLNKWIEEWKVLIEEVSNWQ